MKALSIHPFYAWAIVLGYKTVECRSWRTSYRGDIVICSTAKKEPGTIPGHALCIARIADIVPFTRKHLKPALMDPDSYVPGLYAWILEDIRIIRPEPVKGKLSLWEYDGKLEIVDDLLTTGDADKLYKEIWEPLMV